MMERDANDTKQPPKLKSLDLRELGAVGDALDGLVCDIDDPDCEVPSGAASRPLDLGPVDLSPRDTTPRDERLTEMAPSDD